MRWSSWKNRGWCCPSEHLVVCCESAQRPIRGSRAPATKSLQGSAVTTFTLHRHDAEQARELIDELADAYLVGYADDPDVGHSVYARDEFVQRTSRQALSLGFTLVVVRDDEAALQGFSFGLPFQAGRWWGGEQQIAPPDELVRVAKFAVIELVVLPPARGQRLATRLLREVLRDRPEPWAMLLADQSGHARTMYDRWGWTPAGTVRPAPDVPPLDVLAFPLQQR